MEKLSFKKLLRGQRSGSQVSNASQVPRNRRGGLASYHFRQEKLCNQLLKHAKEDNGNKIKEVLGGGVELEEVDYGVPALVCASGCGFIDTVAVLLRYGAHVNSCDDTGSAPLHAAARKGHCSTMAMLLSRGASVDLLNKSDKRTALHLATLNGHDLAVRLLVDNHACINQPDIYGSTPLHLAARMGRKSTVQILLDNKADVNHYDNDGWTSLHLAAETGNLTVLSYLLENNAHIDCRNKYGRTPLHWAVAKGNSHVVIELLKHHADPNIKDFNGKKPLNYATSPQISSALKAVTEEHEEIAVTPSIGMFINIDPRNVRSRTVSQSHSLAASSETDTLSATSGPDVADRCSTATASPRVVHTPRLILEDSDTESAPQRHAALSQQSLKISLLGSSSSTDDPPDVVNNNTEYDAMDDGILSDAGAAMRKHKSNTLYTTNKVNDALLGVRNELQTFAKELGQTKNSSVSVEAMELAILNSQKRLFKTEITLSDLQEQFNRDFKLLAQSSDNLFNNLKSRLASNARLRPLFFQSLQHVLAMHINQRDNGWQEVMKAAEGLHNQDQLIQDILNTAPDGLARSHCALLRISPVVAKTPDTCIRDSLAFFEELDLGDWDAKAIMAACLKMVDFTFDPDGDIGEESIKLLSDLLGDDGKELGQRLGISLIEMAKYEVNLKESSQSFLVEMLSHYNKSTEKNKRVTIATCLVEIGREDVLETLIRR